MWYINRGQIITHTADVDLLLIVSEGMKENVKEELAKRIHEYRFPTEVVFGDDDSYFYHFRKEGQCTLDIEIFERDSTYYKANRLLGNSIFAQYYVLSTVGLHFLEELIYIPKRSSPLAQRKDMFLNDRKSVNEFIDKMKRSENQNIDPRRVLTINIDNFYWLISGVHSHDIDMIIDHIREETLLSEDMCTKLREILDMSGAAVQSKYSTVKEITIQILDLLRVKAETL